MYKDVLKNRMTQEDNNHVCKGMPPLKPIPEVSVGKFIYDRLLGNCVDSPALVDALTGQCISYKQILSKTCRSAESLRRVGYNEASIITICSENSLEFCIPVIAALYIGAIVAPINQNYTLPEMIHVLQISKPQLVFCSMRVYPKFLELKRKLDFIKKILIIDGDSDDTNALEYFVINTLSTTEPLYRFHLADVDVDNQVAFLLCSSGTTGLPKCVMITQKNVVVKFMDFEDPRLVDQNEKRSILGFLPLFHAYGLFVCLSAINNSIKFVVIKQFEQNLFLKSIETYRITTLMLVPPLAVLLAKSPLLKKYDLSSVKYVSCGAAMLSAKIQDLLKERLKVNTIRQGYGLTETTLAVIGSTLDDPRSGSCGKVLPYVLCKIRDPNTGKSLGPNQVGEICVKGPTVMKGYYENEEATKAAFTEDGWLLTGDSGYYDKEEFFFIVGRLKELIKYKGFQVAPAELEAVLLTNPKIQDAAVIGLPDEEAGELPVAFIVTEQKSRITEEEVHKFLEDKVSAHKKLRGGVIFIKEIPKNPSGKILRRKLHELLKKSYQAKL